MLPWPVVCTIAALIVLLVLVIRYQFQAFVALLIVSLGLGIAAGLPPGRTLAALGAGIGEIATGVAVILALGAMLGRMLDVSGAAGVIARTLVQIFGPSRASLAILVAAYLIGIPVLFNVGFLLLIPIMWQLQRETNQSLLWFVLPLCFSLSTAHSLIPPHPGIVGAVGTLAGSVADRAMVETILFGTLMGIPILLIGWFGPGQWWARQQFVTPPAQLADQPQENKADSEDRPAFLLCVLIVVLPLILSLGGFLVKLLEDLHYLPPWMSQPVYPATELPAWLGVLGHSPRAWIQFLGHPIMALLIPTGLAFWLLGARRGLKVDQLTKVAGMGLNDVGAMFFLFAAAGGFKEVIKASGAGEEIARLMLELPVSPVIVAWLVAVLMRLALGSATAAILAASALLAGLARSLPGWETLLILAVANGVTVGTQPADSGFWLVKEYCNLSVRDVLIRFNLCRITMSVTGLLLLLLWQGLFFS